MKFKIKVNRRNAHLDENKRKAMVYSEKLSNYYDFIDEIIEKLESKRKNIDPRKGKLLLDKHQETVAEIQNNEKIYDDVRKEANKLNDSSKLPSGKMPTPYALLAVGYGSVLAILLPPKLILNPF